jgi:hypothetical protein
VSQHSRLSDHSLEDFNRMKSSSLTRTVCGVIFNVRIGKDFGLKNSVFYTRTVLTENNRFLCIFSFTVFIVNEYFTTVTKLGICAHHLLLTIILSILKCVTLYQVTIIPSYLYSEMRAHVENHSTDSSGQWWGFHSVVILETVVRQSGVLAHRKTCLFCKVFFVKPFVMLIYMVVCTGVPPWIFLDLLQ